jgi:hypothetical protein
MKGSSSAHAQKMLIPTFGQTVRSVCAPTAAIPVASNLTQNGKSRMVYVSMSIALRICHSLCQKMREGAQFSAMNAPEALTKLPNASNKWIKYQPEFNVLSVQDAVISKATLYFTILPLDTTHFAITSNLNITILLVAVNRKVL